MLSFLIHHNYMKISSNIKHLRVLSLAALFLPNVSFAFTLAQVLGYIDIVIGLFLAASVISYAGGMILWATRYGTWAREDAFPFLQFGITTLFVISVLLALIHWFLKHTSTILYVISFILVILCGVLVMRSVRGKKEEPGLGPPRGPPR